MIRDQELTISDEELFTSSAYQKYLTSMAKAATGRYRQGLQALMEWDARADAGIAHTDNYKIHINAANEITQSFPSRYLRSESLVGFNGHETAHLLFSDFTALAISCIGVIFNSILMYLYFAHSVFVDLKILLSGLVIHLLFLLLWIFIITKSLVISAGKKYARALLSACDSGNID